jgi:hypothetical protein
VPLSPFLEENERGGINCLMSLGVTVIADGKSLVQTSLRLHQSIKFRNFSFFLSVAAEKKHIIQNSSRKILLTVLLIGTKKDEGRANRQRSGRSREAAP